MLTGLVLSGVVALGTQLPSAPAAAAAARETPAAPFSKLFQPSTAPAADLQFGESKAQPPNVPIQPDRTVTGPRRKVVCGMTLLIVGSEADPEMAKPVPKDHVTYTMRRYPPPACGKDSESDKKK